MNWVRIARFSLVLEPDLFAENRSAMLPASLRNLHIDLGRESVASTPRLR